MRGEARGSGTLWEAWGSGEGRRERGQRLEGLGLRGDEALAAPLGGEGSVQGNGVLGLSTASWR